MMNFAGIVQVSEKYQNNTAVTPTPNASNSAESDSFTQIYSQLGTPTDATKTENQTASTDQIETSKANSKTPETAADPQQDSAANTAEEAQAEGPNVIQHRSSEEDEAAKGAIQPAQHQESQSDEPQAAQAVVENDKEVHTPPAAETVLANPHSTSEKRIFNAAPAQSSNSKAVADTTTNGVQHSAVASDTIETDDAAQVNALQQGADESGDASVGEVDRKNVGTAQVFAAQKSEIAQDRVQVNEAVQKSTAKAAADPVLPEQPHKTAEQIVAAPTEGSKDKLAPTASSQAPAQANTGAESAAPNILADSSNQDPSESEKREGSRDDAPREVNAASSTRGASSNFVSHTALLAQSTQVQSVTIEPGQAKPDLEFRFGAENISINQALAEAAFRPHVAHSPETAQRIAVQLTEAFASKGQRKVDVVLNPKELGRVKMQLATSESGVKVVIHAERSDTIDLMRKHVGELQKEFENMGFESISFEFSSGDTQSQSQQMDAQAEQVSSNSAAEADDETIAAPQPIQTLSLGGSGLDMRV